MPDLFIGFDEQPVFPSPVAAPSVSAPRQPDGQNVVSLFDPGKDSKFSHYIPDWNKGGYRIIWDSLAGKHRLHLETNGNPAALQVYTGNRFGLHDWSGNGYLVVRGTAAADTQRLRITMINKDGAGYATEILLTSQVRDHRIPIEALKPSSYLLLPRPYPGFQPLYFDPRSTLPLKLAGIERLQFSILPRSGTKAAIEIESIQLKN